MNSSTDNGTASLMATEEFDAGRALQTARLLIRTARRLPSPYLLDRDLAASVCQMVGNGSIDPETTPAAIYGEIPTAEEIETQRVLDAAGDAPFEGDLISTGRAYPRQTGDNLVITGLAFPLAWEAEIAADPTVRNMEVVLDGHLENTVHAAAKGILEGAA